MPFGFLLPRSLTPRVPRLGARPLRAGPIRTRTSPLARLRRPSLPRSPYVSRPPERGAPGSGTVLELLADVPLVPLAVAGVVVLGVWLTMASWPRRVFDPPTGPTIRRVLLPGEVVYLNVYQQGDSAVVPPDPPDVWFGFGSDWPAEEIYLGGVGEVTGRVIELGDTVNTGSPPGTPPADVVGGFRGSYWRVLNEAGEEVSSWPSGTFTEVFRTGAGSYFIQRRRYEVRIQNSDGDVVPLPTDDGLAPSPFPPPDPPGIAPASFASARGLLLPAGVPPVPSAASGVSVGRSSEEGAPEADRAALPSVLARPARSPRVPAVSPGARPITPDRGPAADPEPELRPTPVAAAVVAGSVIGGAGSGTRPTLEGMGKELGRVEEKLEKVLRDGPAPTSLGEVLDLLGDILNLLGSTDAGTTYVLRHACGTAPDGSPLPLVEVPVPPSAGPAAGIITRLDAIAEMIDLHKQLRQPVCKGKPVGESVTVTAVEVYPEA